MKSPIATLNIGELSTLDDHLMFAGKFDFVSVKVLNRPSPYLVN